MKSPSFYSDRSPTDETLEAIKAWDPVSPNQWLRFIFESWNHDNGSLREIDNEIHLATGGWSGNELIIQAMQANGPLWSLLWKASHRGGLYVLMSPQF